MTYFNYTDYTDYMVSRLSELLKRRKETTGSANIAAFKPGPVMLRPTKKQIRKAIGAAMAQIRGKETQWLTV